ncbi:MAG: gliding motility-associated C-terminal domain-containing protein [Crocinitomicaceae bacterium]|nr:gliding motility-associated C-terminal domain-containing protein [Crocinitomicaceae bacterium]
MRLLTSILTFCSLLAFNGYSQDSQNIVHIPNIFTPDGDGVNDVFRISAAGFEDIKVSIYNRYGEVVYKYFGENGSWDGYTHAGVKVSSGVYYVYVEVTNSGGTTFTDQETLQVHY